MKTLRIVFFVMMWMVMAKSPLFSIIYGRIEGFVRDKDTGQVLANVQVILHTLRDDLGETRTDKKGFFIFNKVKPRNDYYVICREDYHVSNVPQYVCHSEMSWIDNPVVRQAVGVFNLKEGEIRKMDIGLEKGGIIKGKILQKDADGIKPFNDVYFELFKKFEEKDIYKNSVSFGGVSIGMKHPTDNGEFSYTGLRPSDNYTIIIEPFKYFAKQYIKDFKVIENGTYVIDFTFDFFSQTGIKGIVTKNGIPLESVIIWFSKMPGREWFGNMNTDENGKYSFLMAQPGYYKVEYSYFENDIEYEKEVNIKIDQNELKIINIEF